MQSHLAPSPTDLKRKRLIDPVTLLWFYVNPDKKREGLTGQEWRLVNPNYVDHDGLLTKLQGQALDDAIKSGSVITAELWRERNLFRKVTYSQNNQVYVDTLTGLPPIDPQTGKLLEITTAVARPNIIAGSWSSIEKFIYFYGNTVFVQVKDRTPTPLVGSQLLSAIEAGLVGGINVKTQSVIKIRHNARKTLSDSNLAALASPTEIRSPQAPNSLPIRRQASSLKESRDRLENKRRRDSKEIASTSSSSSTCALFSSLNVSSSPSVLTVTTTTPFANAANLHPSVVDEAKPVIPVDSEKLDEEQVNYTPLYLLSADEKHKQSWNGFNDVQLQLSDAGIYPLESLFSDSDIAGQPFDHEMNPIKPTI